MTNHTHPVTLTPLLGFPEVSEGDDVAEIILTVLQHQGIRLLDGDILVVSSKVVSKAMGLRAPAGAQAEVVLSQTVRIVAERMTPAGPTRIVESVAGPVMTAAGVDASNTANELILLLLPQDPDTVAAQIQGALQSGWLARSGSPALTGVILSDTAGRPWRMGQTDFALGSSGIQVMDDLRGSADANGRLLSVTERCVADEIAAAADLVKGKTAGIPCAHVRGLGKYVRRGNLVPHELVPHGSIPDESITDESMPGAPAPDDSITDESAADEPGPDAKSLIRTGPQDWFGYGMVEAVRAALGVEPGSEAATAVGIPFLTREPAPTRATRALRVALLTCPDVVASLHDGTISLVGPDDFTLGVAATRTEVALRGEGLTATMTRVPAPTSSSSPAQESPTSERVPGDPAADLLAKVRADPLTSQVTVLIVFR